VTGDGSPGALARLAELRAAIEAAEAESVAEAGLEALAEAITAADSRLRQLRKRRDALDAEIGEVTAERRARTAERDEKVRQLVVLEVPVTSIAEAAKITESRVRNLLGAKPGGRSEPTATGEPVGLGAERAS
jgi:chromosome segregation ATPase